MNTERYVNLACQQGYLSHSALKQARTAARDRRKSGQAGSVWDVVKEMGLVESSQAREVEASVATGAYRGLLVDRWRMQQRLGSGGMGDVYLGDPADGEGDQVAIKLLPRRLCADPEHLNRFLRETEALKLLDDDHITRFIASGEVDARPYLVMELVRGPSLKERLREHGALRQREALHLIQQISGAMAKAADLGFVHRDIKPANLLLGKPRPGVEEPFHAKLCDFGLVKFLQSRAEDMGMDGDLTMSGIALGTPHYMSPEQATGDHDIDARSDIYSLAATVYHCMMGRTLFSGKTSAVIMYKQVTATIDVEPLRDRGCGDDLIELLRDMLRKDREERPATWGEVHQRASEVLEHLATTDSERIALGVAPAAPGEPPLDLAPSAEAGMPRGLYRARQRRVRGIAALVAGSLVLVAILGWALAPPGSGHRQFVTGPAEFTAVMDEARAALEDANLAMRTHGGAPPRIEVLLEPGIYRGNWRLDQRHAGLVLRASGSGVLVDGGNATPLEIADGATRIGLVGLQLRGVASTLQVSTGGEVSCEDVRLVGPGPMVVDGGRIGMSGCDIEVPIRVRGRAEFSATGCTISVAAPALVADGASVLLQGSTFIATAGSSDAALVQIDRGTLRAEETRIDAARVAVGLHTNACTWVDLREVVITGAGTGWRCHDSEVAVLRGLDIDAQELGVDWQGPVDDSWQWSGFDLVAPEPSRGLPNRPATAAD